MWLNECSLDKFVDMIVEILYTIHMETNLLTPFIEFLVYNSGRNINRNEKKRHAQ